MLEFLKEIDAVDSVDAAIAVLQDTLQKESSLRYEGVIENAVLFATRYHKGQMRKSGLPYIVHPICVAAITAYYSGDETMIASALLHDTVEDTPCTLETIEEYFGSEITSLVDALTKIQEMKDDADMKSHIISKQLQSALTFRKMLVASITDVRALVIKVSDRLHNMMTLDALKKERQLAISKETLLVYAPIAHRLGISSLKNELENLAFLHVFPDSYEMIATYLSENKASIARLLDGLSKELSTLLQANGFSEDSFEIQSRIKRPYSIYLKMQKKGISIDEVLDLLALRILVKTPLLCYKVLGLIHTHFKPIVSRFKDYIALPKENGYKTIHTTIFTENSIYEIQIRDFDMHVNAEYGIAAHWRYKSVMPNLEWLKNLQYKNDNIEEFYELAKNDLYNEDIVVFSPNGDTYSLPVGAIALDFAYAVHSEVGDNALKAYVNNIETSLIQILKSGDIVRIEVGESNLRCTYIDIVKTSRAKSCLKARCNTRLKELSFKTTINILTTIFDREKLHPILKRYILTRHLEDLATKAASDINALENLKDKITSSLMLQGNFITRMMMVSYSKLKEYHFDNIRIYANHTITGVIFDCCCHPKTDDAIMAFKERDKVIVHHKLCSNAYERLQTYTPMVFAQWYDTNLAIFKVILVLENNQTTLAKFLNDMTKMHTRLRNIDYNSTNTHFMNCEILIEGLNKDILGLKKLAKERYKIIEFKGLKDAYDKSGKS